MHCLSESRGMCEAVDRLLCRGTGGLMVDDSRENCEHRRAVSFNGVDEREEGGCIFYAQNNARKECMINYCQCDLLFDPLFSLSFWKANPLDHIISDRCHSTFYVHQCNFLLVVPTD